MKRQPRHTMNRQFNRNKLIHISTLLGIIVFWNCADVAPRNITLHPTEANMPEESQLIRITHGLVDSAVGSRVDMLGGYSVLFKRGKLDGQAHEVFGYIKDIAIAQNNDIYILDSRLNEIRVFDRAGNWLRSFGGPGPGPNEFEDPSALEITADNELVVADRAGQLKVYALNADSIQFTEIVRLDIQPEGFCILGRHMYVHAWRPDGTIIQKFTLDGEHVLGFGNEYKANVTFISDQLSSGIIACDNETNTIFAMFELLPFVYAYSVSGELIWNARLEEFQPMRIVERQTEGGPTITFESNAIHDIAVSMTDFIGPNILVQFAREFPVSDTATAGISHFEIHSYSISAYNGSGLFLGTEIPVVYHTNYLRLYGARLLPYPHLVVSEFSPQTTSGKQ